MSRDSVLYRSLAYIDTNLCPPQAVLCICHVHIPIPPSLSILLLPISFPPSPFRHPLSLPPSIRDRLPLSTSLLVPLYASNRGPPRPPSSLNVPVDPAASCPLSRSLALLASDGGFLACIHRQNSKLCVDACLCPFLLGDRGGVTRTTLITTLTTKECVMYT